MSSTPSDSTAQALTLLRELGADALDHPGGTLLAHLSRVQDQLAVWGARPALQLAGLCHAFYGTDGFTTALLPLDRRAELAAVIGAEAEAIVYFYASCDRTASYPTFADPDAAFRDRFTGRTFTPDRRLRQDFAELSAANELDIARIDPAFREAWGAGLLTLFTRLRPLLSRPAWKDCRTVLTTSPSPAGTASGNGDAPRPWTVAVLGPGGVGGLLAAVLSRAGHRVICVAGETTALALRQDGIRVRSGQFGDFTATVEADTQLREPVDLCLIAVKHTALDEALHRVPPGVLGDGVVVPLLNGVEHPDLLRGRYGADHVVPGVIRVESSRVSPGSIEHGSPFTEIDLAGAEERCVPLAAMLEGAGVRTRVIEDETAALWAKLAFLAPFALLTTRYGLTIGEVRSERREELVALVEEAAAVSRACGAPADPAKALALYDAFPAGSKSSMQRDAEAGRPLELDAIGGALLRAAEQHRVPVPVGTRLITELRSGRTT